MHVTNLASALGELGHEVSIVSSASWPRWIHVPLISIPSRVLRLIRRDIATLYYTYSRMVLLTIVLFLRQCRYRQFDVASAQDSYAALAVHKGLGNIPIVLTMHTYIGIEATLDNTGEQIDTAAHIHRVRIEKSGIRKARSIICVDSRIAGHMKEEVPEKASTVSVIKNFLDPNQFIPYPDESKAELRQAYGWGPDQKIILCPRRLVEKNGVIYAVQAMNLIRNSNTLLMLAGAGPQQQAIKAYIHEHDLEQRVVFLGDIPNDKMAEIYGLADVTVIPSITVKGLQEATSISALEGMSYGVPVIASNIGGLKELITDGETGFLVPEQAPQKLAQRIDQILGSPDLARQIGQKARAFIIASASSRNAAQRFLTLFNDILHE